MTATAMLSVTCRGGCSFFILLYRCCQIFLDAVQADADVALRDAHDFGDLAVGKSVQIQNDQSPLRRRQRADRGIKLLDDAIVSFRLRRWVAWCGNIGN